jgi:hypothetical protein
MKRMVVAAVLLGTMVGATGCCRKSGSSGSSSGTLQKGATSSLVTMGNAGVQFNAPAGWVRYSDGDWTKFKPTDNTARLAFVTFDRPGEATSRIGQIAGQLGLSGIAWGDAKVGNIGPNALPARMGDGSATLGSDPAYVWYATINPGGAQQVLVVYAVNNRVGKFHQTNADAAVKTIRKL